jgi:hypothetical protein
MYETGTFKQTGVLCTMMIHMKNSSFISDDPEGAWVRQTDQGGMGERESDQSWAHGIVAWKNEG